MGKLSVLGAQRIKALESMLDDKMKEEISALPRITQRSAEEMAREEFGIQGKYEEAKAMTEDANKLIEELNLITGNDDYVALSESSSYRNNSPFSKRVDALYEENNGKAQEKDIKAKYARKKQMLWLCETLEEAKEIVGLEDDADGDARTN